MLRPIRRPFVPFVVRALWIASCTIPCVSGCTKQSKEQGPDAVRANPPKRPTVTALGRIEPGEGVIAISGPPGERVEKLLVEVGQPVREGEQLLELSVEKVLETKVAVARERLSQAQSLLEAENAHGRALLAEFEISRQRAQEIPDLQIETQQAEVNVVSNQLQQAERDLERMQKANFSESEQDRQEQLCDRYRETLRAFRAKIRMLEKEKELATLELDRKIASAQAGLIKAQRAIDLGSAEKAVTLAQEELQRAIIVAPLDAEVLDVMVQAGESIGQRPVLTLGRSDQIFVVAEVYEADIARVEPGQTAVVRSVALPKDLSARVERIGSFVQRNEVLGLDPTARTDARVIEVRLRLDEPIYAARLVNLQVDVTIDTPEKAAEP